MPFGLTIGTERATALQNSIQDELITRGYSTDADPVMAEYITIMIINNKTADQITSELQDLIGADFDPSFTDWLFTEAEKGSPESEPAGNATSPSTENVPSSDPAPAQSNESSRKPPQAPRNSTYQQALAQALPSSSQKRTASARSPSPNHPNKIRRTDVPTGPRAMQREGPPNTRSLIDRVGAAPSHGTNQNGFNQRDEIQARIDNIVNSDPSMMMNGFPGMNGMDLNAMNGMNNPVMLQELMMNQMALMAQITGMMNPGQFGGFPMQGMMPGDMGMIQNAGMNGFQGNATGGGHGQGSRGRGRGRGGSDRGRGAPASTPPSGKPEDKSAPASEVPSSSTSTIPIAAPTPTPTSGVGATASTASTPVAARPAYAVPDRPQSPTLCKFGLSCTNAHCRWSHPSPVATVESGVVLSNDPCEQGKNCKDKDCIKAHVSPATLKPISTPPQPPQPTYTPPSNPVPCRFGASCTRPGCTFSHPRQSSTHHSQPCRFGASCTKAACPFQHPEGRVLPTSFHRGLSTSAPLVTVPNPETGSIGGPSPHKSVTFNQPGAGIREKLQKQMKEIEEKKNEAEKAVREAEAAASSGKKDDTKPVPIAV